MKKVFTLAVSLTIFSLSFAQWNVTISHRNFYTAANENYANASLIVNSFSDEVYSIVVDGYQHQINKGSRRGNYTNIGRLVPGRHTISVYEWKTNFFGKTKEKFVYSTVMFLKPNIETALVIDKHERFSITEQPIYVNNLGYDHYHR